MGSCTSRSGIIVKNPIHVDINTRRPRIVIQALADKHFVSCDLERIVSILVNSSEWNRESEGRDGGRPTRRATIDSPSR